MSELTQAQKQRLEGILSGRRGPGVYTGIKFYTVHEESTPNMWYRIRVVDSKGEVVEFIEKPTMKEAQEELSRRGYKIWVE